MKKYEIAAVIVSMVGIAGVFTLLTSAIWIGGEVGAKLAITSIFVCIVFWGLSAYISAVGKSLSGDTSGKDMK